MKEIYELDIYKLAENLSDLIWYAFDNWSDKEKKRLVIRAKCLYQEY